MYKIVILSNGKHIIYELKEDNSWHFPCIIDVVKSHEGPFISFEPMTTFCKGDIMRPIHPNHILVDYEPDKSVINTFEEFKKRYHDALNKIKDEDKQDKIKLNRTNNTFH